MTAHGDDPEPDKLDIQLTDMNVSFAIVLMNVTSSKMVSLQKSVEPSEQPEDDATEPIQLK